MKYQSTVLKMAIHLPSQNAVFGEGATHIEIDDEAGGAFIVIRQEPNDLPKQEIKLDLEELDAIAKAARDMVIAYEKHHIHRTS